MDKIKLQEMALDTMGLTRRRIPWDSAFSSMWKWTWICPVQVKATTLKIR